MAPHKIYTPETSMKSPLALLAETVDPRRRARLLGDLAEQHDAAGHPYSATLARIVAESERLLADPGYEPEDPSWEHEIWHPLASTSHRLRRAAHLERVHAEWARPRVGADADVLLAIAETERDAAAAVDPEPPPADEVEEAVDGDGEDIRQGQRLGPLLARFMPPAAVIIAVLLVALPGVGGDVKTLAAAAVFLVLALWVAVTFIRDRRGWRS